MYKLQSVLAKHQLAKNRPAIYTTIGAKTEHACVLLDELLVDLGEYAVGAAGFGLVVGDGGRGVAHHDAESRGLSDQVGGRPRDWQHAKGVGTLDYHGRARRAEIRWFQAKGARKAGFKIKKWLD